jgi:hypothetical protein
MTFVFLVIAFVVFLLGWAVHSGWSASRRGHSEEKAHDYACRRRRGSPIASARQRAQSSIMLLGDDETRTACRVTHLSTTHLRTCTERGFHEGAQVRVACGGDEFIGYVDEDQVTAGGHTTEIVICATTCHGFGPMARLDRWLGR